MNGQHGHLAQYPAEVVKKQELEIVILINVPEVITKLDFVICTDVPPRFQILGIVAAMKDLIIAIQPIATLKLKDANQPSVETTTYTNANLKDRDRTF